VNTAERLYIYIGTANDNQLNDEHTVHPNKIFEVVADRENLMTYDNKFKAFDI